MEAHLKNGPLSTILDWIGIWDLSYSQLNKFLKDLIHTCHHVRPSKFSEVINTQYSMHEASIMSLRLKKIIQSVVMFISENKLQISIFSLTSHFRVLVTRALRLECGTEWLLKALLTEAIQWVYVYIYSKQFEILIWIWHCLIRRNIYEQKKTHLNPFIVNGLTSLMSD